MRSIQSQDKACEWLYIRLKCGLHRAMIECVSGTIPVLSVAFSEPG